MAASQPDNEAIFCAARDIPDPDRFAMDVQRYLADEPVLACPPTAGYRLRKSAIKYRGPTPVRDGLRYLASLQEGHRSLKKSVKASVMIGS